jgi:adenylate cyclase class 2
LIIKRLGLAPRQVYEKYRETFQLGDVEVVLDEMPYGDFVELEGSEAAIRAAADQLAIDWQGRILINYLGLFSLLKQQYDLTFDDLTFANFEDCPVSAENLFR